ncbi:MAG: hypothetical protein ACLQU5_06835 [Isosphaeraceae bacterium]
MRKDSMPENPYDQLVAETKEVRRVLTEAIGAIALARAAVAEAHAVTAHLQAGTTLRREEWTASLDLPAPSPRPDYRAILASLIDQLVTGDGPSIKIAIRLAKHALGPSVRTSSDPTDQLATLAGDTLEKNT